MMAPKYEQARLLHAAIDAATEALDAPVERIAFVGKRIVAWSAKRHVTMAPTYSTSTGDNGVPILGGGNWGVQLVDNEPDDVPKRPGFFARVRR